MNIDPTDAVIRKLPENILSFVPQVKTGGQVPPIPSGIQQIQSGILSEIWELPTWYPFQIFGRDLVNPNYSSGWDPALIFRWDALKARYSSRRDPT